MWKKLRHPNVVPFVGVTKNPLQFISEWMPNGILTEYVSENPGANRIGLVSPPSSIAVRSMILSPSAIRCGRRSRVPSRKTHHARGLERGRYLLWAALSCIDNIRSAQYSH